VAINSPWVILVILRSCLSSSLSPLIIVSHPRCYLLSSSYPCHCWLLHSTLSIIFLSFVLSTRPPSLNWPCLSFRSSLRPSLVNICIVSKCLPCHCELNDGTSPGARTTTTNLVVWTDVSPRRPPSQEVSQEETSSLSPDAPVLCLTRTSDSLTSTSHHLASSALLTFAYV
jgi:hypothetical protein